MVLNGPIIHKKIESLILTPICALSLKFRPIVLPMDANLIIKIEETSRAQGTVYIDGINSKMFIIDLAGSEKIQTLNTAKKMQ